MSRVTMCHMMSPKSETTRALAARHSRLTDSDIYVYHSSHHTVVLLVGSDVYGPDDLTDTVV